MVTRANWMKSRPLVNMYEREYAEDEMKGRRLKSSVY